MAKIMKCKIENILGVNNIEFAPQGQSVTIGGANNQGKSSAINSLIMALGGKERVPAVPLKEGAESGNVEIILDNLKVKLSVKKDRKTSLVVESLDGAIYKSPQAMLDKLFGGLSFDPGAFRSIAPDQQRLALFKVAGIDLSAINNKIETAFNYRSEASRVVKNLEAQVGQLSKPYDPELPEDLIDDSELKSFIADADAKTLARGNQSQKISDIKTELEKNLNNKEIRLRFIETKKAEILALQKLIEEESTMVTNLVKQSVELEAKLEDAEKQIQTMPTVSTDELTGKISELNLKNNSITENNRARKLFEDLKAAQANEVEKTNLLESLRAEKLKMLTEAKLPIEGLSFTDSGVLFEGIPFQQISESKQWEVSTAIGFALNPKGIVFMSASGGLDKKSREKVRQRASLCGVQLFMEVVDDAEDVQIVIEEGRIEENRLENKA